MSFIIFAMRNKTIILIIAAAALSCSPGSRSAHRASTGTIGGSLDRGDLRLPFYGSPVYLIPVTAINEDWWFKIAEPHHPLAEPSSGPLESWRRTTCDDVGQFHFVGVRPGQYFLYARVLWIDHDPYALTGRAWVGVSTVTTGDSVYVALETPDEFFPTHPPSRKFPVHAYVTDLDLPQPGEYLYVEVLPEVTTRVPARYPETARASRAEGTVLVQALVGKDGYVKATRVCSSVPPFDAAAEESVRHWVFKPALSHDKPIALWITIPVRFSPNAVAE